MTGDIKTLREKTGAGVMECKKAFDDARGDLKKAAVLLRERGLAKAEKKRERSTGAGYVTAYVHNGRVGVLLELRAETDFVVYSEPFRELAHELEMQIAAMDPANVAELLRQPYVRDAARTVDEVVKQTIAKVGENVKVERFIRFAI